MNILSVEQVTKTYGEKVLFDSISFTVSDRQRIGLIGVNGTGKSSLLRIIAGLDSPDSGKLVHANDFRVEYLAQSPEFEEGTTVLEHVFRGSSPLMTALRSYEEALVRLEAEPGNERHQEALFRAQQPMDALNAWEASTQAKTILTKLGITEFHKPVAQLSGGQRKRVALASALIQPADLLILDEPTNHIDNSTAMWLEEQLAKYRGALLLVTHDRYFLDRVTNRILEISRGRLYSYEGNYGVFLEKKAEREEKEAASEDKRQNLLRRELAWLRRGAKARTTKQKARIQRVEELRDREVDGPAETVDMAVGASRLGRKVIEMKDVGKTVGGRQLLRDFSYIVLPRDRVGIIGPNGAGKSTLLNLLAGKLQPDEGTIETGQTVKLAYYTQDNEEMDEKLRVIEYIKEAAEVIRTADGETITASQMLERFLFNGSLQWTPIAKLSGGERRRLYLLRTLMGEPNVLLLDEPTNDLDIQTLTILEDYLDHFPGAVITVSHDRYFLDRTVDHLFAFEEEGLVAFYGNYSEYLEHKAMESQQEQSKAAPETDRSKGRTPNAKADVPVDEPSAGGGRGQNRPRKLSFKEQKEWNEIESVIAGLEERIAALKEEIEASAADYDKVRELYEKEQKASEELDAAMERWTELSELVEEIEGNSHK
ncbi:ABC-F family ATP-binding cassette domain-containing protein [Paenibacillus aurantius]|uniref:ABC-F family ATP-binding cassette domain-containing protein n=1 Tax=Paenibacillus aurantius TaxID=2918900 RepID=A0AA96L9E6_9BACL|nr:ABC-F family ATP-binding cassette domain-containing protein [Paenibacillus aurantius]WNQ09120.1 ABC-F family ATP-binding cassette domain-containing protein [Paenibacillus aurantius]